MSEVIIIGAGLCGTLLALRLAQKGYKVVIYEKRGDMRKQSVESGRSINLALSSRGFQALEMVGLKEQANKLIVRMEGRMLHQINSDEPSFVKYSGREGEWINSISREGLNQLLLDEAEKTDMVQINFNSACQKIDFYQKKVWIQKENEVIEVQGQFIFGADGAYSVVRDKMQAISPKIRFQYSQEYLDTGYKELCIQKSDDPANPYRMDQNSLHIWPRKGFLMIALPNLDGSFTLTLFMPFQGPVSFESLQTDEQVLKFFKEQFPTAYKHMENNLLDDFRNNKSSSLHTVKCFPWNVDGNSLLIGDSAHAIVPFYGQGMNCAFEDCLVIDSIIDQYNGDWKQIATEFERVRKPNTDSIAELAVDNFYEMRDHVANPVFLRKRKIELLLEQKFHDYYSKYSMVTFRPDYSYLKAKVFGRRQDEILMEIAKQNEDYEKIDLEQLIETIRSQIKRIDLNQN